MKRFVAVFLVLTMVLALAGTAMAACDIKAGMWVEFKCDSAAYTAARSSKKTASEVQKGSTALCDKVCGDYARLIVNEKASTTRWFKVADLKKDTSGKAFTHVVWAKGGKGMSTAWKESIVKSSDIKGLYVKVSGHTNLRKSPSLHCKSQGVVKKGDMMKLTGYLGFDDRTTLWVQVCYKGEKLWLSEHFICTRSNGQFRFYDKDGNRVELAR